MGGSLNQPCRVQDDGPTGCKLLFPGANNPLARGDAGTGGIRIG